MRAIWKGSINFGLVSIPVALYPATRREELKFRLLRASDLSPVNYKRVAESDGKEVPWDQIVKGYEYEKGRYVVIKDEDFKRVDLEATDTIDIVDFVEEVALHELAHASGHPTRLNRDLSGGFGSVLYAKEELRAELTSVAVASMRIALRHSQSRELPPVLDRCAQTRSPRGCVSR